MLWRRDRRRLRAQNLRGDNVQQRCLAERLARLGGEQVIGPRDQVVEVRHDRAFHVCHGPLVGQQERIEWILTPAHHLVDGVGISLVDREQQVVDPLRQNLGAGEVVQRLWNPEALRGRIVARARRIEDVVEPGESVFKLLVLAEKLGDVKRDVEEQLPVVYTDRKRRS